MSDSILFGSLIAGLFGVALVYIRLAEAFSIIDLPNAQSVHQVPTVRGAGILFPLAWLAWFLWSGGLLPWVTLGVLILSVVGFIDDLRGVSSFWRLGAQTLAFLLLWTELNGFSLPVSWFLLQAGLCGWVLWRPPSNALAFLAFVFLALGYLNIKSQLYALDTHPGTP